MRKIFALLVFCLMCMVKTYASITITDTITAACNNNGVIKLGASGGTAPYKFKLGYGTYQSSGVFAGLGYGRYFFTVADAAGGIDTITLIVNSTFNVAATYHSSVPSITASVTGGTAPYQYLWPGFYQNAFSDSSEVRGYNYAPLFPGKYMVQVRDNNGCLTADSSLKITSPANLSIYTFIKSGHSCYSSDDDSIVLIAGGGAGGYTYQLGSTMLLGDFPQNVYPITGSGYSLAAVNDNNNNFAATYFHYYRPAPVQLGALVNKASGAHQHDGAVSLAVSGGQGGYTYSWSTGATAASITGLAPGTYSVTVSEVGGCSVTASYIVGPPVLSQNATDVACFGDTTGQVSLSVIAAYTPYVFNIAGGHAGASNNFGGLAAGTYTFYVTDSTGEQDSITATITQPTALAISPTVQNPDSGVADGFISVNVSGGTAGYGYQWSVGNNTQNYLSGLFPGIYGVTVTDAHNCTISATYDLVLSGVEDLSANHITLQPNPTTGVVTITGLPVSETLVVYDIAGRLIYSIPVTGSSQKIEMNTQASGVYILKIVNADGACIGQAKIIKE